MQPIISLIMFRPPQIVYMPVFQDVNSDTNESIYDCSMTSKSVMDMVKDLLNVDGRMTDNPTIIRNAVNKLLRYQKILSYNQVLFRKYIYDIEYAIDYMQSLLEN
jgi:hypothetical protein